MVSLLERLEAATRYLVHLNRKPPETKRNSPVSVWHPSKFCSAATLPNTRSVDARPARQSARPSVSTRAGNTRFAAAPHSRAASARLARLRERRAVIDEESTPRSLSGCAPRWPDACAETLRSNRCCPRRPRRGVHQRLLIAALRERSSRTDTVVERASNVRVRGANTIASPVRTKHRPEPRDVVAEHRTVVEARRFIRASAAEYRERAGSTAGSRHSS